MQHYYAMKTRYFVIELAKGVSLIGVSVCIALAVILEMMQRYDPASRMAYLIGLIICMCILLAGLFFTIAAFHFERALFGRKKEDFALLQRELAGEDAVTAHDLIVTDHFVIIYTKQFANFCTLVRMKDIIACYENPVYGTVEKIKDYTVSIYDKHFDLYSIVFQEDSAEDGSRGVQKILARKPWIFHENQVEFEDRRVTRDGRKALLKELESRRASSRK